MAREKTDTNLKPLAHESTSGFSMSRGQGASGLLARSVYDTQTAHSPNMSARGSRRRAARRSSTGIPSYPRGLSTPQILDAFPSEAKELVPRHITRLNRIIAPYNKWMIDLYGKSYSDFDKWFIVQAAQLCGAPVAEIKYLEKLKKLRYFMREGVSNMPVSQLDIEKAREVPIESLVTCIPRGRKWWCQCPFHEDKTPSMIINENNTAKCFSCQWFGDSISFVQKKEELSFIDAVRYLNKL